MSDMDDFLDEARNANSLRVAQSLGAKLKKAGGEWIGPCPAHGGEDRFSINPQKGVFNCRGAEGGKGAIDLVMHMTGCSATATAERINGRPRPNGSHDETEEERAARLARNAQRQADIERQREEQRAIEAAKAKRDEEAIDAILERALDLDDPRASHSKAYLEARKLKADKRITDDIRFVAELDYYGERANGDGKIEWLATMPAIIAIIRNRHGNVIGLSRTYLDPAAPRKWQPTGSSTNSPRKIRGEKKGGFIRLGRRPSETIAISEGWENALSWRQLNPDFDGKVVAAVDLGNLSGGATDTIDHPLLKDADGKPRQIQNGVPDPNKPGVIIPKEVKEIRIVADNDNEPGALIAHLLTATRRFQGQGLEVSLVWPPARCDWNNVLLGETPKAKYPVEVEALRHPGGTESGEAFVERARLLLDPPGAKPRLEIDRSHPERTVTELRDILVASGKLYDRGTPVRVVFDQALGGSTAHALTADGLALEAHFACQPYVLVKAREGLVERDAPLPLQVARMYLGWRGEWRLPPLNGIATSPLLSEDGSIRTARGYDAATGLWCERVPDVGDLVPLNPTLSQAEAALALIRDAFKTFCFADAETISGGAGVVVDLSKAPGMDESAFLAALLGSVCRPCLDLAPGTLFRGAPYSGSGSGKGKLARCVCAIAYGRQPSAIAPGGNPEELEKRVSGALLEGGPAVLFDNFNDVTLRSASLESALTERPAKVRRFGSLDLIVLNALASVFVTGNGVLLARDTVRRFIQAELDAHMEDPEGRSFSGDIVAEMMRNRPALLGALLTIWRYGRRTGGLKRGVSLGSYEQWGVWVRDPLLALGCGDPVTRVSELKQRDPFRQTTSALFAAWWKNHGPSPQTAHQLDIEVLRLLDPHNRGRQYVASHLEKLDGTRLGGFTLTRQKGLGLYAVATYALQKTGDHSTLQPDDTDA